MQQQQHQERRSSGLFSVLRWFRGQGDGAVVERSRAGSSSSSCESIASGGASGNNSSSSRDTVASFSYVTAGEYGTENGPRKYLAPRPETHTYKARVVEREARRAADCRLTLATKYQLRPSEDQHSLPLMTRKSGNVDGRIARHRRAASESDTRICGGVRRGPHVRGKGRAPDPPPPAAGDTTGRRKRMAPQPPHLSPSTDTICNDTLKLEKGVLMSARQAEVAASSAATAAVVVSQFAPRPWYKRSMSSRSTDHDKRKSSCNMSFLTNISELDRQTMQILERETLKLRYLKAGSGGDGSEPHSAPPFMQPKHTGGNTDSWLAPRRRSARDLIAKFNAITGAGKGQEQGSSGGADAIAVTAATNLSVTGSPELKTARPSRLPWNCPRCKLPNEYWRIICRVCSAIKPYFDDFSTDKTSDVTSKCDKLQGPLVTNNELAMFGKQIFEKLPTNFQVQSGALAEAPARLSQPKDVLLTTNDTSADNPIPKTNMLDQILNNIKQNETETEAKLQMLPLGTHANHHRPQFQNYTQTDFNSNNLNNEMRIEKLILGDEINVEKPRYVNVINGFKEGNSKYEDRNMKIIENISFGDEINVTNSMFVAKGYEEAKDVGAEVKDREVNDKNKEETSKKEEREMLKKMLIEMKNSLSKRSVNRAKEGGGNRVSVVCEEVVGGNDASSDKPAEILVVTTETTYENIKVRKDGDGRAVKVSAGCQTGGRTKHMTCASATYELLGEDEWADRGGAPGMAHTYANVREREPPPPSDTSDLARQLEAAIAGGQLTAAAELARRLAELRLPCTVVPTATPAIATCAAPVHEDQTEISVHMYVEDRISHRGPFPLRTRPGATVADLRNAVEQEHAIPAALQRWILGDRLAADDTATLADHQVTSDGCPIFLYLVQPSNNQQSLGVRCEAGPSRVADTVASAVVEVESEDNVWRCGACTLLNPVASDECEACGAFRVSTIVVAGSPPTSQHTYLQLVNLDNEDLIRTRDSFECLVCLSRCPVGEGVVLRECLHQFCRQCLEQAVDLCEEAVVNCPYRDSVYSCGESVQEREVRALVSAEGYERHLRRSVAQAESTLANAYHCRTRDCPGWCLYEPEVNVFRCPACKRTNCLTCRAVHEDVDCAEHQRRTHQDREARGTRDWLEDAVARGEALPCPTCRVTLMKKWGCDWLRCTMCKTEICWVTRGPRWGPRGKGDTSAGCRCGLDGQKCHPNCNYCH